MSRMIHKCVLYLHVVHILTDAVVQYHLKLFILYHREPVMVFEGQEKDNFWNVLGGKKDYINDKRLQVSARMLVMSRTEL